MPLERRMPEEANARGHTLERLTSGRYAERDSPASAAQSQHTGPVPEGGLASHAVEDKPPAYLPPPQAEVPRHATWRCQNGTQAADTAGEVLVCPAAGGASDQPRSPWQAYRGYRWREVPHARWTVATGPIPSSRWPGDAGAPHLAPRAWECGKAPPGSSNPTGKGAADVRAPSPRTRLGSDAVAADLWRSPGTFLWGGHRSPLQPSPVSAAVRAQTGSLEGLRPHRS